MYDLCRIMTLTSQIKSLLALAGEVGIIIYKLLINRIIKHWRKFFIRQ